MFYLYDKYLRKFKFIKKILLIVFLMGSIFVTNTLWRNYYTLSDSVLKIDSDRNSVIKGKNITKLKYILLWTNPSNFPFVYFGEGTKVFEEKNCKWTNCFVTGVRNHLDDYRKFDVIVFNGPQLKDCFDAGDLPKSRSKHQKYVYANIESAANYHLCAKTWNGFFNWTWTYKLDSDAVWGYFTIKNSTGHVVGPKLNMEWNVNTNTVDENFIMKLKSKKNTAAWFVSNCLTLSHREDFVEEIGKHLKKYGLSIDVYGLCGLMQCPKNIMQRCLDILENDYYFYFAFENAISEDYVTEKVLHALGHNTVPVVFGGANYSRFLPPDSYLDAINLGAEKLAKKMNDLILHPDMYYKYFHWKKHYSYHLRHEDPSTDDYCQFCSMINDDILRNKNTIYENFDEWWKYVDDCPFSSMYTI